MNTVLENLKKRGWHLTENGLKKMQESSKVDIGPNANVEKIIQVALNSDLRDISCGISSNTKESLDENLVLQILKVRNIAVPKIHEESKNGPKLLKLQLTDGHGLYSAIEMENIKDISTNTAPGTKVYLKGKSVKQSHGIILLYSKNLDVLGGHVASLVEKWEVNRTLAKYAKGRMNLNANGPPRWIPFGKEIPKLKQDDSFNSLNESQAKIFTENENSGFNSQRTEAISEAIKIETKKVFGGGTKQLLDKNVQKIIGKGYSEEQAKTALKYSKNNVDYALNNLQKQGEKNRGYREKIESSGNIPVDSKSRINSKFEREDRGDSIKPSNTISLFDFVEEKLPQDGLDNESGLPLESVSKMKYSYQNQKLDVRGRVASANLDRFENNISSSFAERNYSKKFSNFNNQNSVNPHQNYDSNRYGNRENRAKPRESKIRYEASENNEQNWQIDRKGEQDVRYYGDNQYKKKGRSEIEYQNSSDSQPRSSQQPSQGRNSYHQNEHYRETSQKQVLKKFYESKQSHKVDKTNVENISERVSLMKVKSNFERNSNRTTSRQENKHAVSGSHKQNSYSSAGNSYNPYQIVGFQDKASNDFAMNMLKTQQLPPGISQSVGPVIFPISNIAAPVQPTAQFVPQLSAVPSFTATHTTLMPNSQQNVVPSVFNSYTSNPSLRTSYSVSKSSSAKWNIGDICLAKYWEDGRFYTAEITGLSENTNVVKFVEYGNYEEVLKKDCLPTNSVPAIPASTGNRQDYSNNQVRSKEQRLYVPPPAQKK